MNSPQIEPFEKKRAQIIIGALLFFVIAPYFWAALLAPPGEVWGGLLWSADDQNVHLAWAKQAQHGHFFVRDLFTTEGLISGEKPLFFNILPAAMGVLSRITSIAPIWFYHLFRVGFAAWALWQFFLLVAAIFPAPRVRLSALLLAAFSTGAGFLALAFPVLLPKIFWIDRPDSPGFPMMPEAFLFTSAFAYPLNIASYGLLAFLARRVWQEPQKPRELAVVFGTALLLSNIHTYDALPFGFALVLWMAWNLFKDNRAVLPVCLAAIIGLAGPVLYQFLVFRGSEEFRLKALTPTPAPPPLHLLIVFAPILILATIGAWKARRNPALWLLVSWIFAVVVLIYTPVSFARKMLEGVQIPLVILAGVGLGAIAARISRPKIAIGATILVLAVSPLYFVGWTLQNAAENNAARLGVLMPPLYLPSGDWNALHEIAVRPKSGAILCAPFLGSYAPRETGRHVFIGHWAETLHFEEKWSKTRQFYSGQMAPETARQWLNSNQIEFIIEGPYERAIGQNGVSLARQLKLPTVQSWENLEGGPTLLFAVPE